MSDSDPPTVLCCGTKDPGQASQSAVIFVASLVLGSPHEIQFGSQVMLPGIDASDISWSPQLPIIFVLDKSARQVWMAPWNGPDQPLPPTPQWTVGFGVPEVPILAHRFVRLGASEDAAEFTTPNGLGYYVKRSGANLQFIPFIVGVGATPVPAWHVERNGALPVPGVLRLSAITDGAALDYEVRYLLDPLAPPILAGVHPGPGEVEGILCPDLFFDLPGPRYVIAGSDRSPVSVTPIVRYGEAIGGSTLTLDRDIALPAELLYVGVNRLFGPQARVRLQSPAATAVSLSCFLLVDVREAEVDPMIDPIVPLSTGGVTLSGPSIYPFSVELPAGADHAILRARFDVPAIEALQNVVLFFQIAVADPGGGVALSSVAGSAILPAWASPMAGAAAPPAARSGQPGRSRSEWLRSMQEAVERSRRGESVREARVMLGQDSETGAPSEADRERWRALRRQLSR
ncbi:MAG: hypothetical protein AB7T19_02635 [Planctomycetota bacterium]